jgi:hypothetical protein
MACDPKDSDQQTYRLFRNRGGRFEIEKPDGVMKFSGYRMKVSVLDLDGDGRPELAVSSYEIPAAGALAGGRVVRRLFIYRSEPERLFSQRPALKHEETFGARDVKGIGQRLFLDADLLGRRVHDALLVDREGSLAAIHFTPELSLESEPFWSFMPEKMILRIEAADLNGDSRSDLILHHKNLLTVLVSRP